MIFYTYNPEFDEESFDMMRKRNPGFSQRNPSNSAIIYLLEMDEETIGYIWIEKMSNHSELVEFYFAGNEAKKWNLYDFIVKTSKKHGKPCLIMSVPRGEQQEEFLRKWGGEVRERNKEDNIVSIPFHANLRP